MMRLKIGKCLYFAVIGISIFLIGILLIPIGILGVFFYVLWSITDKILRLLEVKI